MNSIRTARALTLPPLRQAPPHLLIQLIFLLLPGSLRPAVAAAAELYKCELQGRITYTDRRCDDAAVQRTPPAATPVAGSVLTRPTAPSAAQASEQQRQQAELARLQQQRELRERQDQRLRDLAARGSAARDRKCRELARQLRWREEDLRDADLRRAPTARKRLRRATERFEDECR